MKIKSILLVVALTAQFLFADRILLVVPARYDMVNLGFDLMEMLPGSLDLACYKGYASLTRLEFYKSKEGRWGTFPGEDLISGAAPFNKADGLVFVGNDPIAVYLARSIGWAKPKANPSGQYLHEVANAVHMIHPLTEEQWDKLASTYGFRLKKMPVQSRYELADERQRAKKEKAKAMARRRVVPPARPPVVAPSPVVAPPARPPVEAVPEVAPPPVVAPPARPPVEAVPEVAPPPVVAPPVRPPVEASPEVVLLPIDERSDSPSEPEEEPTDASEDETSAVPVVDHSLRSPLAEEGDMVSFHIIDVSMFTDDDPPAEEPEVSGEPVALPPVPPAPVVAPVAPSPEVAPVAPVAPAPVSPSPEVASAAPAVPVPLPSAPVVVEVKPTDSATPVAPAPATTTHSLVVAPVAHAAPLHLPKGEPSVIVLEPIVITIKESGNRE